MTTIPNPIVSSAAARPEHPALVCVGESVTYRDLMELVARRASGLMAAGVTVGDRVALVGEPGLDWVVAFHAIGWVGAVVVPLSMDSTEEELADQIERVDPALVLSAMDELAQLCDEGFQVQGLAQEVNSGTAPERFWPLEEPRCILFTSGTTGAPQMVELTTAQLLFSAFGSTVRLGHTPADSWLACLPLHHVGGLSILLRCAWLGTTVVLQAPFCPHQVNALIDEWDTTMLSVVPAMLERILDARSDRNFPQTLRVVLVGGDHCPEKLVLRAHSLGAPLALTWGMTECASQIATRFVGDFSDTSGAGPALPFARVAATEGVLEVSGPVVQGGSLATRDCGDIDPLGRIQITGRRDALIISGGENIAPSEVETVLMRHPAVRGVAVVARPSVRWGQRPVAFIECAADCHDELLLSDLAGLCVEHLSRFKVPDAFWRIEALPRNATGKTDTRRLTAWAAGVGVDDELEVVECFEQKVGDRSRLEALQVHDGVDEGDRSSQLSIVPKDSVAKGHGFLAESGHLDDDSQSVAESHGGSVVSFGVNERHAPVLCGKDGGQAAAEGHEHLFEGSMTVFVDSAEESDSGSVNLVEADRDDMFESHETSVTTLRGGGS